MELALAIIGVIMLIGFLGNWIFKKTDIPSMIWLLAFGLVLGPITHAINASLFIQVSGFFAAVAIIIILFDGGIHIDLYKLLREAPRGVMLTIIAFTVSVIITTIVMMLFRYSLLNGILMGAIVGGTSSPIVIPIISKLRGVSGKTRIILSLESALTDVLCIVVAIAVMQALSVGSGVSIGFALKAIANAFSIGIVLGFIAGVIWLPLMRKIIKEEFSYVVTLAVLFLLYAFVQYLEGSGAVACLVFGIVLGNGKKVFQMIKYEDYAFEITTSMKNFHSLIAFFIRTFFFVYLGLLVSIQSITNIFIGLIIVAGLLVTRPFAVRIAMKGSKEIKDFDRKVMSVMLPRGLAAAVLAYLPIAMNIRGTEAFPDVAFTVIMATALASTIGILYIMKREKQEQNTKEGTKNNKQHAVKVRAKQ